ncbi:hypothetical protein BTA51_05895 [Hahella sp. CCB-MM4]|nr:hypothetical protein BTA51_05895 [Hahella sp. CCB-MM4]
MFGSPENRTDFSKVGQPNKARILPVHPKAPKFRPQTSTSAQSLEFLTPEKQDNSPHEHEQYLTKLPATIRRMKSHTRRKLFV